MLAHYLIIPVFDRDVADCLEAVHRSAATCGVNDYTAIVADGGSKNVHKPGANERVVTCHGLEPIRCLPNELPPFNKPRTLNAGIDAVADKEAILTFLDADARVGERFMEAPYSADTHDRVCYRVRTHHKKNEKPWGEAPISYEAYGDADSDWSFRLRADPPELPPSDLSPQGNSQFSIRKSLLGETRFNERYFGRSFEDLWMMRELFRRGLNDTVIYTEESHAMWHRRTATGRNFEPGRWSDRNWRMYHGKTTTWVVGTSQRLLEKFNAALTGLPGGSKPGCRFCHRDEFAANAFQEVIPEIDRFIMLDRSRIMASSGCPMMIVDGETVLRESWEQILHWIGLKPSSREMAESRSRLEAA
jgi:hypothetical protein